MVDLGKPEIFEWQMPQASQSVGDVHRSGTYIFEKLLQMSLIHVL